MNLTATQTLLTIAALLAGTIATRFLPFLLFPPHKKTPPYILYLGDALPFAVTGLLVVFCLKDVSLKTPPYGLPELIAILCILGVHLWKKNALLSIGGGTLVYMLLVQYVFL